MGRRAMIVRSKRALHSGCSRTINRILTKVEDFPFSEAGKSNRQKSLRVL